MPYILIDTGIWICHLDPRDNIDQQENVAQILDLNIGNIFLVPWPTMFETIRTRMARNSDRLDRLGYLLRSLNIVFIDDEPYRDAALEMALDPPPRFTTHGLSMVDCLIRLIIEDPDVKVDYLATLNSDDFRDACISSRVVILPD